MKARIFAIFLLLLITACSITMISKSANVEINTKQDVDSKMETDLDTKEYGEQKILDSIK